MANDGTIAQLATSPDLDPLQALEPRHPKHSIPPIDSAQTSECSSIHLVNEVCHSKEGSSIEFRYSNED